MSIAGGVALAIERAESVGCTALQIFLKNSNRWRGKKISPEQAERFQADFERSNLRIAFGHDSYPINLGSPDDELFEKSIRALTFEVEQANPLGIPFIVIHPGSPGDKGDEWGLRRIADGTRKVIDRTPESRVRIAFEVTAGQGRHVGYRFEHLDALIRGVDAPERTGACLDTCHMYAAGYDLGAAATYEETMRQFDEIVGFDQLLAFHLNDTKKGLASRVDRHEHIGRGALGLEAFRLILNDPRIALVPKVIETPKEGGLERDMENLTVLRGLREESGAKTA